MMKLPAKPKSSPGRPDEFPPPLIMFPRSKSTRGTRSRSSSNPRFVRKIATSNGNEANQEPSSPKVTCIGQVRVKRLNNKQTTSSAAVRNCKLLRKSKPRWLTFRRVWRGRISFLRCDCCGKSEKLPESTENEVKRGIGDVIGAFHEELIAEPPPRNALLLTRSRSAPYRYSYADNRIWESSMEREDDKTRKIEVVVNGEDEGVNEKEIREDEGSINGDEELKAEVKPVNLSRCKSEPGRTGDKLFTSFTCSA